MKNWYIQFFGLKKDGICKVCYKRTDGYFCSLKCKKAYEDKVEWIRKERIAIDRKHKKTLKIEDRFKRDKELTKVDNRARKLSDKLSTGNMSKSV